MSASNPTRDEVRYLAKLDMVRCDGFDQTSPALARRVLELEQALGAVVSCQEIHAAILKDAKTVLEKIL